ncbi:hypothetical protein JCM6882_000172 [Rhodosporidiobolus microsporus]
MTSLSRTASSTAALYNPAVAVFTAELVKASVSLAMLARQRSQLARGKKGSKGGGLLGQAAAALSDLRRNQKRECVKLAVPAALYALQNTLLLKLLTTAPFSIVFFRRRLSVLNWFSLFLLTLGIAIVQLDTIDPASGFAAIFAACISSGLAGGWFEYVLKAPSSAPPPPPPSSSTASNSPTPSSPISPSTPKLPSFPPQLRANSPTLWARNLQLSVPSLLFSFLGVLLSRPVWSAWEKHSADGVVSALGGMWDGFSPLVWGVVANQAIGGLLVAMVVRKADSVAKGFATSIAIVLSTLSSAVLFHIVPGNLFILGAGLVIGSTVLYSLDRD